MNETTDEQLKQLNAHSIFPNMSIHSVKGKRKLCYKYDNGLIEPVGHEFLGFPCDGIFFVNKVGSSFSCVIKLEDFDHLDDPKSFLSLMQSNDHCVKALRDACENTEEGLSYSDIVRIILKTASLEDVTERRRTGIVDELNKELDEFSSE